MLQEPPESFTFRINGLWGAFAAAVAFLAVAVPLAIALRSHVFRPGLERWRARQSTKRSIAWNAFRLDWLLEHTRKPVFILDERKRCIFVNESLTELLQIDSSEFEGKGWHKFIKGSELSREIAKWDEAYEHQSPYQNESMILVGRRTYRFLVTADPFIYGGKTRNMLGTMELMTDEQEPRQLME